MIIEEFKSDSTLIKIDDKYIETGKKNKELINILISLMIRKIQERQ